MSSVTFTPYENRLAGIIHKPGGVKVAEALRRAEEQLETIRDEGLSEVDLLLARIEQLHLEGGPEPAPQVSQELYQLGNDVLGTAGVVGLSELGEAARTFCDLIERLRNRGGWDVAAVEVHLAAFRLLRHPDESQQRLPILEGLRRVTDRIPAPSPEADAA